MLYYNSINKFELVTIFFSNIIYFHHLEMKGSSVILREPSLKRCFMQMGNKFGLSPDIIKMLYNYKRKVENEGVESVRLFHKNMILFQCLDTCGNLLKTNYIQSWKGKYDQHIGTKIGPITRGIFVSKLDEKILDKTATNYWDNTHTFHTRK